MKALFSTALMLVCALPAGAGSLAGVSMPDTAQLDGEQLVLNGMALRKKFFVKVYVAGLYLPAKESSAEAILGADAPRRAVMHWLYAAGKDDICAGWYEGLEANTPGASPELRADFDQLCGWMKDAVKGERYLFTYVPGTGTTVEVAGKSMGVIPGKAFADALFASWIGPDPGPGAGFKKDLLGG